MDRIERLEQLAGLVRGAVHRAEVPGRSYGGVHVNDYREMKRILSELDGPAETILTREHRKLLEKISLYAKDIKGRTDSAYYASNEHYIRDHSTDIMNLVTRILTEVKGE